MSLKTFSVHFGALFLISSGCFAAPAWTILDDFSGTGVSKAVDPTSCLDYRLRIPPRQNKKDELVIKISRTRHHKLPGMWNGAVYEITPDRLITSDLHFRGFMPTEDYNAFAQRYFYERGNAHNFLLMIYFGATAPLRHMELRYETTNAEGAISTLGSQISTDGMKFEGLCEASLTKSSTDLQTVR